MIRTIEYKDRIDKWVVPIPIIQKLYNIRLIVDKALARLFEMGSEWLAMSLAFSTTKTIYFKNTVSTDDIIFKRDADGNRWKRFYDGSEAMTPNSRTAWQSYCLCLREVTKKEYDDFQNNPNPYYEDWESNIIIYRDDLERSP